jgi:hypothetical protein
VDYLGVSIMATCRTRQYPTQGANQAACQTNQTTTTMTGGVRCKSLQTPIA